MKGPERIFWIGGSTWLVGLALVDVASNGTQRPFLAALLIFGGLALWLVTEWAVRAEAVRHPRRRR